jgi:hypothetical protein
MVPLRTLGTKEDPAIISLNLIDEHPRGTKWSLKSITESFKEDPNTQQVQTVKCALREGHCFLYMEVDGDPKIQAEFFPHSPGKLLLYRLIASPKSFESALKEFEAARKTLEKM